MQVTKGRFSSVAISHNKKIGLLQMELISIGYSRSGVRLRKGASPVHGLYVVVLLLGGGCTDSRVVPGAAFDLGPVLATETPMISHVFSVTNPTRKDVVLNGKTCSCDCSEADLRLVTLRPGQTTDLRVGVKLTESFARRTVSCNISTDHPDFPTWTYELLFQSYGHARVVPDRLELKPAPDTTGTMRGELRLEVYGRSEAALAIRPSVSMTPTLLAVLDPTAEYTTLANGILCASYRIVVSSAPAFQTSGTFSEPVSVAFANGPSVAGMVMWSVQSPIIVTPNKVHFGLIDSRNGKVATVKVRSATGEAFGLFPDNEVETESLVTFNCTSFGEVKAEHELEFEIHRVSDESARAISGIARLRTGLADMPAVQIPWSALLR